MPFFEFDRETAFVHIRKMKLNVNFMEIPPQSFPTDKIALRSFTHRGLADIRPAASGNWRGHGDLAAPLEEGIAVDVWAARTDRPSAGAAEFLSDRERRRMNAFADRKARSRYAEIHGILRILLAWYLDANPGRVHIDYTPEGKPFLPRQELHFNLSHAGDAALFAFCKAHPVGVDVEPVRGLPEAGHMAERWFSLDERIWISSSPQPEHAFTRCWVCREAIGKASGRGLAHALQPAVLKYLAGRLLSAENYFVSDWEPWAGYVAAVACLPGIGRIAPRLEASADCGNPLAPRPRLRRR